MSKVIRNGLVMEIGVDEAIMGRIMSYKRTDHLGIRGLIGREMKLFH